MKGIWRVILIATYALRRNILRAILTVLGIVIGIASVIAMMEIGAGSSSAIQKTIASMGANTLLVLPGIASSGGVSFGSGTELSLVEADAIAIAQNIATVKVAAPIIRSKGQLVYGNRNWVPMNIYGSAADFLVARDWPIAEGEIFSERDLKSSAKVCLIGQTLVRELFQNESPIGKEVRLQNVSLKVIGTLAAKGANMTGMDQDDSLLLPWTSLKFRVTSTTQSPIPTPVAPIPNITGSNTTGSLYPSNSVSLYPSVDSKNNLITSSRTLNIDQILVAVTSADKISETMRDITRLLRERHRIKPGAADDFSIRDMTEITKAMSSTSSLMTRLLLSVALISLVVGGVGIMNIVLVSVTERTREIGLRMAVGAKGKDILQQFLAEAIVLCMAGGVIGLGLGKAASFLVARVLLWPVESSWLAVGAAIFVSMSVGLIFGFYPAWKASRLDPIQALRYE